MIMKLSSIFCAIIMCCCHYFLAISELIDIPIWSQVPYQMSNPREQPRNSNAAIANVHDPKLTKFEDEAVRKKGLYYDRNLSIVVMPGGAYEYLSSMNEGVNVCTYLNSLGFKSYMLIYRHRPYSHPIPLIDAFRAVRMVRKESEGGAVGVMGFSAGGHLAASVLTFASLDPSLYLNQEGAFDTKKEPHSSEWLGTEDNLASKFSCRPDFSVLFYPVISMMPGLRHDVSRMNIGGSRIGSPMTALDRLLSLEKSVVLHKNTTSHTKSPKMGPVLLIHSGDDQVVPVQNSLHYFMALLSLNTGVNNGQRGEDRTEVDAELRVYSDGNHGYGMGRKNRIAPGWYTERGIFRDWLERKMAFISSKR